MKFTKHQKETILRIYNGDIYDITSYLKYFNLGELVKFDKEEIINNFNSDDIPKRYYCRNSLIRKYSNIITENDYFTKSQNGEINSDNYSAYSLNLSYNTGIKRELWNGVEYSLDFYSGVYIANCFDDILEFLTLWQFLISEMLILEIPYTFSAETLGLFYIKTPNRTSKNLTLDERIKQINFEDFTYDDKYYLNTENYTLSQEHCLMCKEYMNKRIYPSKKLGLFIKKRYTTYGESAQNKTLFVAYLTILVSIALTIIPHFQQKNNLSLKDTKLSLETIEFTEDLSKKLDIIINKLDTLTKKLSPENTHTEPRNDTQY